MNERPWQDEKTPLCDLWQEGYYMSRYRAMDIEQWARHAENLLREGLGHMREAYRNSVFEHLQAAADADRDVPAASTACVWPYFVVSAVITASGTVALAHGYGLLACFLFVMAILCVWHRGPRHEPGT